MMPFRLPRLSAPILARDGPGAICAAFFLCFSAAWAQTIPEGYVATREGDVIVMRPSAAADPDIAIRVYPPIADDDDAGAVVRRWAQSHPLAGVDPSALRLQSETLSGVSSLYRIWKSGAQVRQELILMPQAGPGRYQPVVVRMPSQPGELLQKHSEAAGRVVALIKFGKFQPPGPVDGKGNPAVAPAPVESAAKRAAPERAAPARAARAETRATTEQLARFTAEIETVGLMVRAEGMGGIVPKPVVLFRSGDALIEMGNLLGATSGEADRAAHPRDWGRWRRTAAGIEIFQGKWDKLPYPKTMQRLPAGFALSGEYERLTAGGDASVGGNGTMVLAQSRYTFRPDGKFSSNGFAGGTSRQEFSGRTTGSTAMAHGPVLEGRYRIDGYLLRLEPAGGQSETHLIATDPKDPGIVWIDGEPYTRP